MSGKVSYLEDPAVMAGGFLQSKGFVLADKHGIASKPDYYADSLGLLINEHSDAKPSTRKSLLSSFVIEKPRRKFIGRLWFNNRARSADEKHWVFEVFGMAYVDHAKQMADEMAALLSVDIVLYLASDLAKAEMFLTDQPIFPD